MASKTTLIAHHHHHSPGEGIKAVSLAGVWEGNAQAGHERRVEDDGSTFVTRSQVHRGHRANALAVKDDVLWRHAVPVGHKGGEGIASVRLTA